VVEVIWTQTARRDLRSIRGYVAMDNAAAADRLARSFLEATSRLADYPELGRRLPQFESREIRQLVVGNYLIPYENSSTGVRILRVRHGARILNQKDLPA
jgi:toxin ParE1/3/4